ncbi:MAG: DUF2191 domain-containing protein [Spirochaetes bacterium]|nr:DUF2191 domain-containing protein [Spirochaetota bacterium]
MKVTALMADTLVDDVRTFSGGRNITESMVIALTDWLRIQKIKQLNAELENEPYEFTLGFSAAKARKANRRVRH